MQWMQAQWGYNWYSAATLFPAVIPARITLTKRAADSQRFKRATIPVSKGPQPHDGCSALRPLWGRRRFATGDYIDRQKLIVNIWNDGKSCEEHLK